MASAFGILYIVSTPIGNLEDISGRALSILASVDLILSEDTRETEKILAKFELKKPQISYTDQKHDRLIEDIISRLKDSKNIALVSDNGTPVISDPGFRLVRECKKVGISVQSIPGPSAVTSALAISGLPSDKFVFIGFLPKNKAQIENLLNNCGNIECTLILYESPYRVKKTLKTIFDLLGDRECCVAKDMTKKFENVKTDKLSNLLVDTSIVEKGEFVILVAKKGYIL